MNQKIIEEMKSNANYLDVAIYHLMMNAEDHDKELEESVSAVVDAARDVKGNLETIIKSFEEESLDRRERLIKLYYKEQIEDDSDAAAPSPKFQTGVDLDSIESE